MTREELLTLVRRRGFESFLKDFPDPLAVYAIDGVFLDGNASFDLWSGHTREELSTLAFGDLLWSEDRILVVTEFNEARAGKTRRFVAAGSTAGGGSYRAQVTLLPVMEKNFACAVVAIFHDVADGKVPRTPQVAVEQRLADYVANMPEALVLIRDDGGIAYMNSSARAVLLTDTESPVEDLSWDRLPLLQGTEFAIAVRATIASGAPTIARDYDARCDVWREARVSAGADGVAIYLRDASVDHEHLNRALGIEAQVVAQAALLNIAHDAIYVRGLDNIVTYWNHAAGDIFGWTSAEMLGTDVRVNIKHEDAAWDRATEIALKEGQWSGRLQKQARDGRMLVMECRWSVVYDELGTPVSILAVNTDITVRKKQEDQLLRVQRMDSLGTLASGIAHDLNNVLTPILLSAQLLMLDEKDSTRADLLSTIESGTRRGAEMLDQILTFGRGVEGVRAPVDIGKLLADVQKFCRDSMPNGIELVLHLDSGLWKPIGDEIQLFQVVVNLVLNARDAMPSGGLLTMSARNLVNDAKSATNLLGPGRYVLIEVEDSGIGMGQEMIAKIFDPFFTTKPIGQGTGLGLSTAIEIVRGHGGRLQVYSEPGNGSQFTLQLPVIEVGSELESEAGQAADSISIPRGHGELILLVDDEEGIRTTARSALAMFGYLVAVAGNGEEAMEYARSVDGAVDLVITDLSMPIMDGPTLIALLRGSYPDVPIIASSGLTNNANIADGSRTAPNGFIGKPYSAGDLLRAVGTALNEHHRFSDVGEADGA